MSNLKKISGDAYDLTGAPGDDGRIRLERSAAGQKQVLLRLYKQSAMGQAAHLWIEEENVDALVDALRFLMTPHCRHCAGTGVEQS